MQWLTSLQSQQFIGAESRLLTVFELLREITWETETDPEIRIEELARRKQEIEQEMAEIRGGRVPLMDSTRLRERFMQMSDTARSLLGDFRQVEQNFRAFWDFLMSPVRQQEFTDLLDKVFSLEQVQQLEPDRRLQRVHFDWLEAGDATQRTVARLSEQLRRYLDDQAWLENRRIMDLIHELEQHALNMRDRARQAPGMMLDKMGPDCRGVCVACCSPVIRSA